MADHIQIGKEGERIAKAYLQRQGYRIYRWNVQVSHEELDIIAYDPIEKCLVFAEVKSRSKDDKHYSPSLNLTTEKKRHILRAARRWVAAKKYEGSWRIDLICIAGKRVVDHLIEVNLKLNGRS